MKKLFILVLLITAIFHQKLTAMEFSDKEKSIIYTNAIKLLGEYQTIINNIGESVVSNMEDTKSAQESLLELFVNRQVLIFNDLDPAHKLSEFYEAETYSSNLILWYPDGITINLDLNNAKVGEIITHEENVFSLDILVQKTINGNYLNQTLNRNTEELTFRIAFSMEKNSPSKLRIVGIRDAASKTAINYNQALKEVNSEEFSQEDIQKVQTEIKTILNDYTQMLALIGDPQELGEDKEHYKESFIALFKEPSIRIYNDISPSPETNLMSVADYIAAYFADYPQGIKNISINADSARFGNVIKSEDGSFYTYTSVNKFFSGSFKGRDAFRQMFPLNFKISFNASGKTFSDFKITGIDIAAVDFFEAAPGAAEIARPELTIKPVTRKGLSVYMSASFGQSGIKDKDIESLSIEKNYHKWTVSPLFGYITTLGVSHFFNDNMSVSSGIEYSKYSSNFNLDGRFRDTITQHFDVNSNIYHRYVEASFDSLVTINYITIPLIFNYISGNPGRIGFYAEGGFKFSVPIKNTYLSQGDLKHYSHHPDAVYYTMEWPTFSELKDNYSLRENINYEGSVKVKGLNASFHASAGVCLPIGYYSFFTLGPEITIGISDVVNKNKYIDIFGKSYTHQATRIRNIGFRVSFNYKL